MNKVKARPGPLGDRWSAIFVRRAASGASLPPGIEARLDPEWLDGVTLAEQDGELGIARWLKAVEVRLRDDPGRVEAIREALALAKDDPGGDPGDGESDSRGVDAAAEEWPAPRFAAVPGVEPFPLACLPAPAQEFVRAVSESVGCPIDFVAGPLVAVAGAAIGRSVSLRLKAGYFATSSLYMMNIGTPSSGKSPALDEVVRPMWQADESLHEEFRREREAFESAMEKYTAAPKGEKPLKPARPTIRSAVLDDVTVEAVAGHLAINPRGLLVSRDEGSAWVAGLNQYKSGGKGADRQFWLSALFGKPIRVDRKGNADQEPVRIAHPFISVIGNLTPDMLGELAESRGRSDGFVERILLIVPDSRRKPRWSELGVPEESRQAWAELVRRLRVVEMNAVDGKACPHAIGLTLEAKLAWISWYDGHVDEVNAPGYNSADLAAEGKLQDFAGRFALVLHMLDLASDPTRGDHEEIPPVSLQAVYGAIALWRYFRSHRRRARWLMTGGFDDPDAKAVVDWARRNGRDSFSVRDVAADLRWLRDCSDGPEGVLGRMAERNIVRRRPDPRRPPGSRGQKPSPTYDVHPAIFERNDSHGGTRNTQNTRNSASDESEGDTRVFREFRVGVEQERGNSSESGFRAEGGA